MGCSVDDQFTGSNSPHFHKQLAVEPGWRINASVAAVHSPEILCCSGAYRWFFLLIVLTAACPTLASYCTDADMTASAMAAVTR
jgi:hypothetical protein